jgi:hypothetical protein
MKTSERIYRWCLRLYPRDFRDEYGDEMSLIFRSRASEGAARLWFQVLGDLLFHAPKEHWSTLKQDLRYALRTLLRAPTLAVTVIATLALGIGANSVIFSAVDAVLLRDAPVSDPDSLVDVYTGSNSNAYSIRPIRTISTYGTVGRSHRWPPIRQCPSRWMQKVSLNPSPGNS